MGWDKALQVASQIHHRNAVAAVAVVVAAFVLTRTLKTKRSAVGIILAIGIIILGVFPNVAFLTLANKGVYRIRITVLGTDGQPVNEATVIPSTGGKSSWRMELGNLISRRKRSLPTVMS